MTQEMIICVPGPWTDRFDFLQKLTLLDPPGRYMFAGMILADVKEKDHVPLEFCGPDPDLLNAFTIAGQGKIPENTLDLIKKHNSVVYFHFPNDLPKQRDRIFKYTDLIRKIGGFAIKVESSGVAHDWEPWTKYLSGSPFDLYCAFVVLIGDQDSYYSCGMHHFGLPECSVARQVPIGEAAELMNRFNFWQIVERPVLESGHTFSIAETSPHFRLSLGQDVRHDSDHLFFNPHGVWSLGAS